jgi:signal transduction histidine kinase
MANSFRVNVRDTGYGIPTSYLSHIFDRFYRVRNNGHDDIEGNGLGLAIVKSIVEEHHGHICVESEVGKGSCFTVNLPLLQHGFLKTANQTFIEMETSNERRQLRSS